MDRVSTQTIVCSLFFMFVSLSSARQQTQPPRQQPPPLAVQNVKGNIYQVTGGAGANTSFFVGDKEVVAIDAKMTEDAARLTIAEIKKVSPNPITKVILTHSDGDHVNGLVGFPQGIDIIAHENTRVHMSKAFQTDQQRAYLPGTTFSDKLSFYVGSGQKVTRIDLLYFGPAHTNGDAVVFFPEEKVAFIGDLLFLGRDPLIHRAKNGTSIGLVKVLNALIGLDAESYISGHNELTTKKEIRTMMQSIEEQQARIQTMVQEGKTLEQVKKAFNIETPAGGSRWPSLVEVIYLDLTEKK
ncbi:MAG: Lactamase protein [Bacteroidetes bacterium]|nr:Lactamase protein [Bacteroidota bacterium]